MYVRPNFFTKQTHFLRGAFLESQEPYTSKATGSCPGLGRRLVISTLTLEGVSVVRLEPKGSKPIVAVPDFGVSTTAARRAFPERVSHEDAYFDVDWTGYECVEYTGEEVKLSDLLDEPYELKNTSGTADPTY